MALHRIRQGLQRAANVLLTALRITAGVMLIASVGVNFANIIGRYFLSVSLSWAEEAMLFLMIGCVFLGAGPVGWMGRHIRMDVVVTGLLLMALLIAIRLFVQGLRHDEVLSPEEAER
jgi:TRAP-type C4-dicarboxylate transport system permease small subunit